MDPQEIEKTYAELAQNAPDYANAMAERIGAAQSALGPMAQRVQGTSTAGLSNYTYNRMLRPQVDILRNDLLAQGMSEALNRQSAMALNAAKQELERAQREYAKRHRGGGGGGGTPTIKPEDRVPTRDEVIPDDYEVGFDDLPFGHQAEYKPLPGTVERYPMRIETPLWSTDFNTYTAQFGTPEEKKQAWLELLRKQGYEV